MTGLLRITKHVFNILEALLALREELILIRENQNQILAVLNGTHNTRNDKIITLKEAADILGIVTRTALRWKNKGVLVPIPASSGNLFLESHVRSLK